MSPATIRRRRKRSHLYPEGHPLQFALARHYWLRRHYRQAHGRAA